MEMEVQGIISRESMGVELESTAEKQSRFARFMEEQKAKRQQRAETRQAKKDDRLFAKIRDELVENVFGMKKRDINHFNKKINEFKEQTQGMTEAERIRNLINVADGAKADQISGITGAVGSAVTGGISIGAGFAGNATLLTVGAFALTGPILAAVGAGLTVALAVYSVLKLRKGKASDTLIKQLGGMEEAQKFMDKIESFIKEIENDKAMLVEKKRSMNKKDFEKYLETYVQSKTEFLKELNVQGFVNALKTAEVEAAKENQKSVAATPSLLGAMA